MTPCPPNCPCRGHLPSDHASEDRRALGERIKAAARDWLGLVVLGVVMALAIWS